MSRTINVPALKVQQPIGDFLIGVMSYEDLIAVSYADVRSMERDVDNYLGIQRRLSPARKKELQAYVNTSDATFPTSIILAVDEECSKWDEDSGVLSLFETDNVPFDRIAKVLDGQHRIDGLRNYKQEKRFDLSVTIFINADLADQANIFATVNLAQTKVNRSLVYDLFDYAKSRSPQKTAHDVTVALDRFEKGPLFERIKRLGVATEGRAAEPLTQATVVTAIMALISNDPMTDREVLLKGKRLGRPDDKTLARLPLRGLFVDGNDLDIAKIVSAYFEAVRDRWPRAWADVQKQGNILPRTNGFKALMRVFRPLYLRLASGDPGRLVVASAFTAQLVAVGLQDDDFSSGRFVPGTGGEAALAKLLSEEMGLGKA